MHPPGAEVIVRKLLKRGGKATLTYSNPGQLLGRQLSYRWTKNADDKLLNCTINIVPTIQGRH